MANDWLELRQHADTGIETIKAHFEGHAFDPHWHDSYLVGITLSGTQQFHCRRERHRSQPGDAFLLEPGEIHDGDAPVEGGFTYLTFYLDERWLTRALQGLYESTPGSYSLHFAQTLTREPQLVRAIGETFSTLHNDEMKIVQQSTMDNLLSRITAHCHWRKKLPSQLQSSAVAHRARDYLYAHIGENVGLSDLARETGTDRFTLTRCFKREFHLAPHAWLIQLRLAKARQMLKSGMLAACASNRSCSVVPPYTSSRACLARCHRGMNTQSGPSEHLRVGLSPSQSKGCTGPSRNRMMSSAVICPAGRASTKPPALPRRLSTKPPRLS